MQVLKDSPEKQLYKHQYFSDFSTKTTSQEYDPQTFWYRISR